MHMQKQQEYTHVVAEPVGKIRVALEEARKEDLSDSGLI